MEKRLLTMRAQKTYSLHLISSRSEQRYHTILLLLSNLPNQQIISLYYANRFFSSRPAEVYYYNNEK